MATGRLPDPNSSPLTAKGDLYTYSTVPAKLAVGSDGETLVADSSATTGLRWQGNYAAGKNAVINGDFRIWQRGTSFANANTLYTADRWILGASTADPTSWTVSQQTFTVGTAPVSGYEGTYFLRSDLTTIGSSTNPRVSQRIEDVRVFAGQTVTLSFWVKFDSTRTITPLIVQQFGTGGSSAVTVTCSSTSIGTSWTRYTSTVAIPSISGKTIGTNSFLEVRLVQPAASGCVMDIWGVQLEVGNTATAFQTATGTLAGELAACQRYYYRWSSALAASAQMTPVFVYAANTTYGVFKLPQTMRVRPTSIETSGTASHFRIVIGGTAYTLTGVPTFDDGNADTVTLQFPYSTGGLTVGYAGLMTANATTSAYIGFIAEL